MYSNKATHPLNAYVTNDIVTTKMITKQEEQLTFGEIRELANQHKVSEMKVLEPIYRVHDIVCNAFNALEQRIRSINFEVKPFTEAEVLEALEVSAQGELLSRREGLRQ